MIFVIFFSTGKFTAQFFTAPKVKVKSTIVPPKCTIFPLKVQFWRETVGDKYQVFIAGRSLCSALTGRLTSDHMPHHWIVDMTRQSSLDYPRIVSDGKIQIPDTEVRALSRYDKIR